ncbi:MAG: S-adenosylmethionine:tRNA ribosyltransferase-isomerase [Myxococcota bacterium]
MHPPRAGSGPPVGAGRGAYRSAPLSANSRRQVSPSGPAARDRDSSTGPRRTTTAPRRTQRRGLADPLADWSFDLPEDRIAREPAARRAGSRLMVLRGEDPPDHHVFSELPALLRPATCWWPTTAG